MNTSPLLPRPWLLALLMAFASIPAFLSAQHTAADSISHKKYLAEIGINVSGTLKNFLGNSTGVLVSDPFIFTFKLLRKNRGLRSGFMYTYDKENDITPDPVIGGSLSHNEQEVLLRLGYEKRIPLHKKIDFHWGIDALMGYRYDFQQFISFASEKFSTTEYSTTLGGGPVTGVRWRINRRINLSTEAFFYGKAIYNKRRNAQPGLQNKKSDNSFLIQPAAPVSIYFNIVL